MGTNKNSCKTAAVMGLIGRGPAAETASPVSVERPRDIETITGEILDAKRAGGEAVLTIGKRLIEAKAMLSHGDWLLWLETRVEFSERTAQNFMRLARHYSNPQTLADLGSSKALMLLAVPEEEREEFISVPHEVDGHEKTVADMSARELAQVIKERDEALRAAAQAQADQTAAEQARAKMAEDMEFVKRQLEMAQEGQNEALAYAKERQEAFDASEREVVRLAQELEALRSRPVEVAVEADPAAIEAARKEAEAQMQAKLDKAKKAQAKAEEARKSAEEAQAEAQRKLERVQAEARAIRDQADKRAALTADADMVLFSELYDQVQIQLKRMGVVRLKKKAKDPERAEGLQNALMALIPVVKEAAGQ